MGFSSQFKNHNAQYANIKYGALGGSIYANSISESASSLQSNSAAALLNCTVSEVAAPADLLTPLALLYTAFTENVGSTDQGSCTIILNLIFIENAAPADTENLNDQFSSPIAETVTGAMSVSVLQVANLTISEMLDASDCPILFGNILTPVERLFTIIREKRSF